MHAFLRAADAAQGSLLYNGAPSFAEYSASTRFVSAEDLHVAALTVDQTLRMASELSTPPDAPFRADLVEYGHVSRGTPLTGTAVRRSTSSSTSLACTRAQLLSNLPQSRVAVSATR